MTSRKTSRAPAAGPPVGAGKQAGRAPRHAPATPAGMIPIVPAGPGFPPVPSEEGSTGGSQSPGARERGEGTSRAPGIHMTEREIEDAIRRILKDLPQIWARHETDSRGARAGWPDWTFLRRAIGPRLGAAMFRELKTATGKLSAAQQECLAFLRAAGLDADVWREEDLRSGRIARELAALAGIGRAR